MVVHNLSVDLKSQFDAEGFVVVPGLFSAGEVALFREHFMEMRKTPQPNDDMPLDLDNPDPLRVYPRLLQPHRHDKTAMDFMLDSRIDAALTEISGASPIAAQTMFYFKPAGARGQALHQDNTYLRAKPGTCYAAWLAIDDCTIENGCMMVVPGSHQLPQMCVVKGDLTKSFTDIMVEVPPGMETRFIEMKAGDVLFFNGQVIHGSLPNTSNGFRRALIGHYVDRSSVQIGKYYHPTYYMDGSPVKLIDGEGEPTCGKFVEMEGEPQLVAVPARGYAEEPAGPH